MMEGLESFIDRYVTYLEEIRVRMYRLAVVFVAAFVLGLASTSLLLPFFVEFFTIPGATIIANSPFQLLELAMNIGFFCAITVSLPFAFQQAYAFLGDALLPRERRLLFWFVPLSIALFLAGFTYGFAVMYYAVTVIAQVNIGFGITNLWNITQFISQILITSALLGVLFEFPLVLSALVRFGLVPLELLRRSRRIAYALIFVFIALLPPTDGLSFLVMSVPLLALYELTIYGNSFGRRKELLEI